MGGGGGGGKKNQVFFLFAGRWPYNRGDRGGA